MKPRYIVTILMLFLCLCIFGQQQSKTVVVQEQAKNTVVQVDANQQDVLRLQKEFEATQKQWEKMEKEIEIYRGDVRTKIADVNEDLSQWLTILAIMMAVIGIAIPISISVRNEKNIEKMLDDVKQQAKSADTQAKEATKQAEHAKRAVVTIEELKKHVTVLEEKIIKDANAAEKAAKDAQSSQLFTQALSEKNSLKAIELYTKAIKLTPNFSEAYNNRGILRNNMGKLFPRIKK